MAEYKHFTLKEIFEQPQAVQETVLGRISLDTGEVCLGDLGTIPLVSRGGKDTQR